MRNITMYRGDDKRVNLTIRVKDTGAAYDLTGCTLKFTVRRYVDGPIVFNNTAVIDNAQGGTAHINITPTYSNNFPLGEFVYDVELTTSGGQIYTIASGKFKVLADITRPET